MIRLLLLLSLQQQPIVIKQFSPAPPLTSPPIPARTITVNDQRQMTLNLHGLPPGADWILGVMTHGHNRLNVSILHKQDIPGVGVKTMKSMEAHDAAHIHMRPGVVDLDGLGALAQDAALMIFLDVPPDTNVIVNRDGARPIYSGKVHDSLQLKQGTALNAPVHSPADLMQTLLVGHAAVPEAPQVLAVGGKHIANMAALKQHVKTRSRPQASVDGSLAACVTITAQGTVGNITFVNGSPALQSAFSAAAQSWTFTPFEEGEVKGLVFVEFRNGTAHSPLWD